MTDIRTDVQTNKFSYRIEPKPEGGFVATPSEPGMPTLEGATREEVQQKIETTITDMVTSQMPTMFKLGLSLMVNRKINITSHAAAASQASDLVSTVPGQEVLSTGDAPIVPERSSSAVLWVLGGVMVLAALIYFSYLHG
jgi:hypothetical protein